MPTTAEQVAGGPGTVTADAVWDVNPTIARTTATITAIDAASARTELVINFLPRDLFPTLPV